MSTTNPGLRLPQPAIERIPSDHAFLYDRHMSPLVFPAHDHPLVSVVIPVHDKHAVTYHCLASLLSSHNDTPFEVIIVDDASTDETQRLPELVEGITVIRNEENRGFVYSCNTGAEHARGDFITFLNNDTEPTAGWLDEMLLVFRNFADVGLVGSKLLYPDGRLQDAGGIVWSNGDPLNYGRGQSASLPEFGYTRQADYLSGASIAVDQATWQQVGGFSEEFAPGYFEDTDLAFKVRSIGKTTVYAPLSVVFHHEGISSGTDTRVGMKKYQEMNRPMFKAKWAKAFAGQPDSGTDPRLAADHRGWHKRALFVDHTLPESGRCAGGPEAVQEMRLLQSLGYKVVFIPEDQASNEAGIEYLQRMGVEVAYTPYVASLAALLEQRGSEFDLVYIGGLDTASHVIKPVRRLSPRAKILLRLNDLSVMRESPEEMRSAIGTEGVLTTRDQGPRAMREVDVLLTYASFEYADKPDHGLASERVALAPQVVDVQEWVAPPAAREGIVYLGGSGDSSDCQAIEFLCSEVMPLVRERRPGTVLHVYGSAWQSDAADRFTADDIAFEGPVDHITDVLGGCRVVVAPLGFGAGLPGQLMHALAHGVPQILATMVQEGTGLRDGMEVYAAESPAEWADHVVTLCNDDAVWQARSEACQRYASQSFSFERGQVLMSRALEMAGEHATPASDALVVRDARPDWSISGSRRGPRTSADAECAW